jgi:predicted kinase
MCHNAGMKEPAILYLIVGLPGAGKTTKARQLEVEASALRFTPDEWMHALFGRNDQATRDVLEGRLIWIALRALQLQTNVILDARILEQRRTVISEVDRQANRSEKPGGVCAS